MTMLAFLIPAALFLGGLGLAGFLWALRSGQYDDLDGSAERILIDDERPGAAPPPASLPGAGLPGNQAGR
jgi:cbb3-type cytochrome oxidase maturation protein